MKLEVLEFLRCPACHGFLEVAQRPERTEQGDGELRCVACRRSWPVRAGIPHLVFPEELQEQDLRARTQWDRIAPLWSAILAATDLMRGLDGAQERKRLVERLELRDARAVLETAAGAGTNLELIARQAGDHISIFGTDLSQRMLSRASRKLRHLARSPELLLANTNALPFADDTFDAVLDGFGMKYYSDKARAIQEMLRVVRPGGTVLIAELGLPVGKRRTLRQRLLLLWIPGFGEPPPVDAVPSGVSNLRLEWDKHETAYTLQFRKPVQSETRNVQALTEAV